MRFKYQITFFNGRAEEIFDSFRDAINFGLSTAYSEWAIWQTLPGLQPKLIMKYNSWGLE